MMKPFDDQGRQLDALYSIEPCPGGFDLIVESRGGSTQGSNPARNSDYAPALELHLLRMGALGMVLMDLQVASSVASKMPKQERRVSLDRFQLPLALSASMDAREVRLSIGRASAAFGRNDGSDRGNRTKRMLLRIQWSGAASLQADQLERLLSRPISEQAIELPTGDDDELQERVSRASSRLRTDMLHGTAAPPSGQTAPMKTAGASTRFIRDPNVIAWVLVKAAGHCEVCGDAAPFLRADGEPFLEVHHVRFLSQGGPDTTDNAVACCPNCHRRFHHDPERDTLRLRVIASIPRLADYPKALVMPSIGLPGEGDQS